jgi:hypothetical protein
VRAGQIVSWRLDISLNSTRTNRKGTGSKEQMDLVKKKGNRGSSKWHGIQSIEFKLANGG